MFENDLAGLDEDATLTAVEGNEHTAVQVEVTRLLLAAHWADLHPGDAVDPHGFPVPNAPSNRVGRAPRRSPTSPPPNWAVP